MIYLATGRAAYTAFGIVVFLAGSALVYAAVPRIQSRVDNWLHPFDDPAGQGYQLVQSLYALAQGGVIGPGLGRAFLVADNGNTIVPALQTDFMFSAVASELGYVGGVGILLGFLVFIQRGFVIAAQANDGFSKLLAGGLTAAIGLQAILIIGGVTRLIPLTGVTLPFMSYGGSSVVTNFVLVALLLIVSHRTATRNGPRRGAGGEPRPRPRRSRRSPREPVDPAPLRRARRRLGLLMLMLGWWQVVAADDLKDRPGNTQTLLADRLIDRGRILSADAKVLAASRAVQGPRPAPVPARYPQGSLAAHAVGYASSDVSVRTGIESTYNRYLSGSFGTEPLLQRLGAKEKRGADVKLSLDTRIQEAAEAGLDGKRGAVIALDPDHGEVLALASFPSFDLQQAVSDFNDIPQKGSPFIDRATAGLYAPGSTFKVVTATAALESGEFTPSSVFDDTGSYATPGGPIHNFDGEVFGRHDLTEALTNSINTTFASLGDDSARHDGRDDDRLRVRRAAPDRPARRRGAGLGAPRGREGAAERGGGDGRGPPRDRPGAPDRDAPPDGDGRVGRHQRRPPDGAPPDDPDRQPGRIRGADGRPQGDRGRHGRDHRGRADGDDGQGRRGGHGHAGELSGVGVTVAGKTGTPSQTTRTATRPGSSASHRPRSPPSPSPWSWRTPRAPAASRPLPSRPTSSARRWRCDRASSPAS